MFSLGGLLPGGDRSADCCLRTTDGGEFRAQRGFLCATSPYFRAAFGKEFGSPRDVFVSGVKKCTLDVLLTFLYTDQLFVSAENVVDVFEAADMLCLDELRDQCLPVLLRFVAPQNCLGLAAITRRHNCPKFTEAVMAYARAQFDQIWRCSENFGETPAWLLYDLLASPELHLRHEEDGLEAIASWYSAAGAAEDSPSLPELLQCVRIGLCEPGALDAFRERWPQLADRADFQEAVTEAVELGPCECSPDPLFVTLREPATPPPIAPLPNLVATPAAGAAGNLNAAGEAYLALNAVATAAAALEKAAIAAANAVAPAAAVAAAGDQEQQRASPMPQTQARCDNCGLANPERWLPRLPCELIFLFGGWTKGQPQSTIETFDNSVNRWFQFKTEGVESRAYHGAVQWRRRLFVVGGLKQPSLLPYQRSYLHSVDSYDLESCEWCHHSPMHVARAFVAVAALGDYVYAIGGHTGVERTRTVERYAPRTNQWTMVAAMNRRRSDGSACVFKGRILISGGFSGSHVLESVEMYSVSEDSWIVVQSLPSPRCGHRMVEHCGRLYVIAGFDGHRRLEDVLRSDESLPLRWRRAPSLAMARSSFGVAHLGGDLYVIGGYNGTSLIAEVERYTPGDKSWLAATAINRPTSGLCAFTVRGSQVSRNFSARSGARALVVARR